MQLKWDSSLDIHVPEMNDEHKVLIDMMNRLAERNDGKAPKAELKKLLNDFVTYALKHFADEEAYMQRVQFPDLAVHQLVHKRLVDKLRGHVQNFEQNLQLLPIEFFDFLQFWLVSHIKGIDMEYGRHVKKRAG